jgi:hypothetical protein
MGMAGSQDPSTHVWAGSADTPTPGILGRAGSPGNWARGSCTHWSGQAAFWAPPPLTS